MEVIKSIPRGYCHGVVNALNLVSNTVKNNTDNKTIYILGEIVHNKNVKKAFEEVGVVTLEGNSRSEMLDSIDDGIVIITAHGIEDQLIEKALNKGLFVVDATCKDVKKTQNLIKEKLEIGYDVIFLGKKNHPETEGIVNIDPSIHLISSSSDLDDLNIKNDKILITNQTTMSKYDTQEVFKYAKKKFPNLEILNEICDATSKRQDAAFNNSKIADLTLVVGDPGSNNTNRLASISEKMGKCPTYLIENVEQINLEWLLKGDVQKVHVTSGASTPTIITSEVIKFLENFDKNDKSSWDNTSKIDILRIIPRTN